jgi:hypothetical protein
MEMVLIYEDANLVFVLFFVCVCVCVDVVGACDEEETLDDRDKK